MLFDPLMIAEVGVKNLAFVAMAIDLKDSKPFNAHVVGLRTEVMLQQALKEMAERIYRDMAVSVN